jgi:phenylalanyl-tRNA synthetase alpha chain
LLFFLNLQSIYLNHLSEMITFDSHETLSHILTAEGSQVALQGSHEARVWAVLPAKGKGTPMTMQELKDAVGSESASVGQGKAFKSKWIGKEGNGFVKLVCVINFFLCSFFMPSIGCFDPRHNTA